jgi:hypothetical protein
MIYATYDPLNTSRPSQVFKTKKAVPEVGDDYLRAYAHLTEKQVNLLSYTQAVFMETLLGEADSKGMD